MRSVLRLTPYTFAGVSLIFAAVAPAAVGDIYYIPTFGGASSVGADVNDSGVVAGYAYLSNGINHAMRFSIGDGILDLGTLGGGASFATAINNSGVITGGADVNSSIGRGFRYESTMESIGALYTGGSIGYGINNAGTIVGNSSTETSEHSFRYTTASGIQDMNLPTSFVATARGIDSTGDIVVGDLRLSSTMRHPFVYRASTNSFYDAGSLGGKAGYALAVNSSGIAVGWATDTNSHARAFRYQVGVGGLQDLGTLGGDESMAFDITAEGVVVGNADDALGQSFAVLWSPQGDIFNVDSWLDSINPALGAYWTLNSIEGVSETGWITGTGIYNDGPGGLNDGERGFLLNASGIVPEPNIVALVPGALIGLLGRRRPRR